MSWTVNPVQPMQKKREDDSPRGTEKQQSAVRFSAILEDMSQGLIQQRKEKQDGFGQNAPAKRFMPEMEMRALARRIDIVNNQVTFLMGEAAEG